jgi:hypothetical protein
LFASVFLDRAYVVKFHTTAWPTQKRRRILMLGTVAAAVLLLGTAIVVAFRGEVLMLGHRHRARRFDAVYKRNRQRAWRRSPLG